MQNKGHEKNVGVLFSGGLDSAALIGHYLQRNYSVWPVYIRCGLPWEKNELHWAFKFLHEISKKNVNPLIIGRWEIGDAYHMNWAIKGPVPGAGSNDESVFLPARNLLLTTKAILCLLSKNVTRYALATLKSNPFQDGKSQYFKDLSKVLSKSFATKIDIETPFKQLSKPLIIKQNTTVPLHMSFSCINFKNRIHCGNCNKCAERQAGFHIAGIQDLTQYQQRPLFQKD